MQILLHIGQSKTGTSAIQSYLALNRSRLAELGILYPLVKVARLRIDHGNHNPLADALCGKLSYPGLSADEYFEQFFEQAEEINASMMILSAEHFFGGEPRVWNVPDEESYFSLYRDKVCSLRRYLQGHDIKIFVYLRPQLDWLSSAIAHTIRIERLIRPRPIYVSDQSFFEMAKPLLRYCTLLDIWNDYLQPQEIIALPYDRAQLKGSNSITDFKYRSGLNKLNLPEKLERLRVNLSLTREYVEIKKQLNKKPRSKNEERVIINCLVRLSKLSQHPSTYLLNGDIVDQLRDFVSNDNTILNERYIAENHHLDYATSSFIKRQEQILPLTEKDLAVAWNNFQREYNSMHTKLARLDYAVRSFLRSKFKPLHAILHQAKRFYWKVKYNSQ